MMVQRSILFVGLMFAGVSLSNSQNAIPLLSSPDIPGGTITRCESYDGNSLWGYIDGGANIYMEYGFVKMLVEEFQWERHHFTVNIYNMKDPEAAFGIFSVSRHKCAQYDSLIPWSCVTPCQIQVARGLYYISVISDSGTKEEQSLALQAARKIFAKLSVADFAPPDIFRIPVFARRTSELKFVRGILGIQNGIPDWQYLFENDSSFSLYFLPIEIDGGYFETALVAFSTERDKRNFLGKTGVDSLRGKVPATVTTNGSTRTVRELTPATIIYTETNLDSKRTKPFVNAIDSLTRKSSR